MPTPSSNHPISIGKAIWPILFFVGVLIYGLFIHPVLLKGEMLPLEVLILLAFTFSCLYCMFLGYSWETIQDHIVKKVGESIGVILILFSIGVLIGSWIVSGTIPMLIYYGIGLIDPNWMYIFAFLVCILFSLLTGTSWGSAGTIGIVMMGIAEVYDADLCITAAAVVGGSFFGDKMSPLSDTTNVAALATDVSLFDHIKSMAYTTGPSAIIAGLIYIALSPTLYGAGTEGIAQPMQITQTLDALEQTFNFNILLLLPLALVVLGSLSKKPIVLTLLCSAWLAMFLTFLFQSFSLSDVLNSFNKGFNTSMSPQEIANADALKILNRGGLYNLISGITSCFLIFAFIGTLDVLNAIETVLAGIMKKIKTPNQAVVAALSSTALTNLTSSNQYATSFIIGESFRRKFDELKIPRKVLSRSIEDAGTMLENLAPWTPSGIFMYATLGISAVQYAPYQFLSLINIVVAFFFALTGIACFFYSDKSSE